MTLQLATGSKSPLTRRLAVLVYSLIALGWLQFLGELAMVYRDGTSLSWTKLICNAVFVLLFSGGLVYFFKKIKAHIAERMEEHFKLFRKNPHPMWIYDLKTLRFQLVNDAAIALYGYREEEFLAMKITDIRSDEDVPALISAVEKARLDFNHQYHWSGIWRHRKKGDQTMYVEISSHDILFNGEQAELVLAYNVTDKVLQDQKLQALNQDLEHKVMSRTNDLLNLNRRLVDQNKVIKSANLDLFTISNQLQDANLKIREHAELKNRFVSMASHEFRTPLANIAFSAGFVRYHFAKLSPENIIAKLQGIETQVAHMAALLEDVLTIGKTDAAEPEVRSNLIDVHDFVARIVNEVQTACNNSHHIQVTMNENAVPVIHTDEKFLRNIFINLLNNAIKYSPAAKTVSVVICSPKPDLICFAVTDHGMGIHKADIDKIFEPFYRTGRTENIKGTGLGLSIVKRAADLLNAVIEVRSEVGRGSTFTVSLPVQAVS